MTESKPLSRIERIRLFGLAALIFIILASYAIARPATESLFLEAHGSKSLPLAWLMVGFGSLAVVTVYNRFAATTDLVRIFGSVSALSAAALMVILFALDMGWSAAIWMLYLWKDLYIVVLIEIFWSFANCTVPEDRAKWWYGLFCVLGSLGGMVGNLGVGWMAQASSTQHSLWAVVVLLGVGGVGGISLAKWAGVQADSNQTKPRLLDGFKVLRSSRSLWLLMALIGTTQVVITLVDYQFSVAVETHYPDADARTAVIGQVYAAIDFASISLQLATGPILRLFGLPCVLLGIPAMLGFAVTGFALVPKFFAIAAGKVASKAFDYSLFRAAKEILYIPLSHAERTQGKAFVDMMAYRMAKGATSLMLLGLVALGHPEMAMSVTIACILLWIWLTVQLNRGHKVKP